MAFSDAEIERYARQIALREIGGPGQARLKMSAVLVIGAGGLGAPVATYLAAAGVGRLVIADDDRVELSNLQRQVVFTTEDVGALKADAAAARLRALNPEIEIEARVARLDAEAIQAIADDFDLIIDGSDNWPTRRAANAAAIASGRPLIFGSVSRWEGQIARFHPSEGGPCLECAFPEPPAIADDCAVGGVAGALTGVIGSMMALSAIHALTGGPTSDRRLTLYDGRSHESSGFRVKKRPDCPACSPR